MSYVAIVESLPQDLQLPMLRLVEAIQQDLRHQLAVRREDFDQLRDVVHELAEAQKRTEQRVEELAEAQKHTELEILALSERQRSMANHLSRVLGSQLEDEYRNKAFAYFGRILRKAQVISLQQLEAELERHLSDEEVEDVELLDVVVSDRVARHPEMPQVLLAIEVSSVVDRGDVERAIRRAALLRKAGYVVVPTVAGEGVTYGAREAAHAEGVFPVQDGHKEFWESALAAALTASSHPTGRLAV